MRRKKIKSFYELVKYYLKSISSILALCILFFLSFSLYHNHIAPAKMPLYILSNGKQTIQFQAMSHIASATFYTAVQNSIIQAKNEDFVLYYEGVRPGSIENTQDFYSALGVKFEADIYQSFAKLYGVQAQDNMYFLDLVNTDDYNIDLSIDDIMKIYKEKKGSSPLNSNKEAPYDIQADIIVQLNSLDNRQLAILRYLNQAILNCIIKNAALRNAIVKNIGNNELFEVILEDRNKHIVDTILQREDTKIFILYGLMHFEGVWKLLQQNDAQWEIQEIHEKQLIYPF